MKISNLVLTALAATLMAGTAMADTAVKIGVLNDRSGIYADLARRRLCKLASAKSSPDQTVLSGGSAPGTAPTSMAAEVLDLRGV